MSETTSILETYLAMAHALNLLRKYKLGVAPDKARFCAVAVTEQEKAVAYMKTFVLALEEIEAAERLLSA